MKTRQKLLPAIAMLLISAVCMTSASFAWFTMSARVTATGINVKVVAPSNLLISPDNSTVASYVEVATADEAFTGAYAVLYAASSNDGIAIFATDNVDVNGLPATDATFANVSKTPVLPGQTVASTKGYYADFTFWIKNTGTEAIECYLRNLTLTPPSAAAQGLTGQAATDYDTRAAALAKAFRVALLSPGSTYVPHVAAGTADAVSKFVGSNGFGPGATASGTYENIWPSYAGSGWLGTPAYTPIVAAGTLPGVTLASLMAPVAYAGLTFTGTTDGTDVFVVPGGANGDGNTPVPVVIRIWLEGQDANCLTSNLTLHSFGFEVQFGNATLRS